MLLLFDIGNTHTHVGLADSRRIIRKINLPSRAWFEHAAEKQIRKFIRKAKIDGVSLCSVVPTATPLVSNFVAKEFRTECLALTYETVSGIGINYPKPETIGPDRLANAVAVKNKFGAPAVVIDFGTAVTFDVVDKKGNYIGGIIAPGLSVMTDYLHEKTALLPKIKIREPKGIVGKNTEQAMLVGAVYGYRGLIRELISDLQRELKCKRLPVVATGGYATLISAKLPEITAIEPLLTLEGLRLVWQANQVVASRLCVSGKPASKHTGEASATTKKGGEKPCLLCDADFDS